MTLPHFTPGERFGDNVAPEQGSEKDPQKNPEQANEPATGNDSAPEGSVNCSKALRTAANTISAVFSPLFSPTFALLLALFITPLAKAPETARLASSVIVFAITAIVPLGVIIAMMRMGLVSDLAISDRRQRTVPFAVSTVCYLIAAGYLRYIHAPAWLCLFFVAAALAALAALFISFRWKISAHTLGMGGLCGMLVWLCAHRLSGHNPFPLIIAAIVLSGAVASARICLGRHTQAQTYAGWLLAFVLSIAIMSLA